MSSNSTPVTGPACKNLPQLLDCVNKIPTDQVNNFTSASAALLKTINSDKHLHVYTLRVCIDEYCHVGVLIDSLYRSRQSSHVNNQDISSGAIIIVDDVEDGFARVTTLASQITRETASTDSSNNAGTSVFSRLAVIKGARPPTNCADAADYEKRLQSAANTTRALLVRFAKKFAAPRVVWHSHADPALLVQLLQTTDRAPIAAITAFDALQLGREEASISHPYPKHSKQVPNPWPLLMAATKTADIPLAFYCGSSLRINLQWCAMHSFPGFDEHWSTMIPLAAWQPELGKTLDSLMLTAFRLLASGKGYVKWSGQDVVREVKRRLPAAMAKGWAKTCIDPDSFDRDACIKVAATALPTFNTSGNPLPALAALTYTVKHPSPISHANALNRLALGPGSNVAALWAVRCTVLPPPAGKPPPPTMEIRLAHPSNVYVVTPSDPEQLATDVGVRWQRYVTALAAAEQRGAGRSGVSAEVAATWKTVVQGTFVDAVREWSESVRRGLAEKGGARFTTEVAALLEAVETDAFTRVCERVLRKKEGLGKKAEERMGGRVDGGGCVPQ